MKRLAILAAVAVCWSGSAVAQAQWITLGTASGPLPNARRAQPANLLLSGTTGILVDVGDGAVDQLAKAGVPLTRVSAVLISHLHFDHTGGLFALLSRRYQLLVPGELTIYGPPGTRATVDAMVAAMAPALSASSNVRQRAGRGPEAGVKVVEIGDGWTGRIGDVAMRAVTNTHYAMQSGATVADTYAFRFDTPSRAIVYTGDTGPSSATTQLATGAELLVSEIMDPAESIAELRASRPDIPLPALAAVEAHFRRQHLDPASAGEMAARAGVSSLVLTHNTLSDGGVARAKVAIAGAYRGKIAFARDLDRF